VRALLGVSFPVMEVLLLSLLSRPWVQLLLMLHLPFPLPLLCIRCGADDVDMLLPPVKDDLRLLGATHAESSEFRCDSSRAAVVVIPSLVSSVGLRMSSLPVLLLAIPKAALVETMPGVPNVDTLSEILVEDGEVYSLGSMKTEYGSPPSSVFLLPFSSSIISILSSRSIKLLRSRENNELSLRRLPLSR